jgi:predicted dehydrogenase
VFPLTNDLVKRKRLKAGMVGGGSGSFFGGYHRAAMRLCDRFDLVAGSFSSKPELCLEAGEALGMEPSRVYTSFADMAAAEAARTDCIDVAIIVTPNHLHFEPAKLFLEAGIPVICEKPMVNSVGEAEELRRLAESKGVFFGVTYTYTGYPMVRDARARIANGEIGTVRFAYVEYLLEWLANDEAQLSAKSSPWRADPVKAGPTGALGDIGTHAFNLLEFVTDQRCTRLNAKLTSSAPDWPLDDNDVLNLEFDGGASGLLWSSLVAPGHRNGLRFKIVGSKGTLEWRQELPETLLLGRSGRADITYRRGHSDMSPGAVIYSSLPAGCPEGYLEALAILYADFADALAAGANWRNATKIPIPGILEGIRGVVLSQKALEADATRQWVDFPTV